MNKLPGSPGLTGLILCFSFLFVTFGASAEVRIQLQNALGDKIESVFVPPPPGKSSSPAVVMLHGCAGLFTISGKVRDRERAWIDILHSEGWAIILPDSFGSRGYGSLCQTKDRPVTPEKQRPYDAMAALKYLAAHPGVDPDRIALLGWSHDAMTGLHTIHDGADAAPPPVKPDFRTAVVFYPGCIALTKTYPKYRPRIPTLIQHGALDDWTLAKPCQKLVRKINETGNGPPVFIDVYPDAYHNFDHPSAKLKTIITKHSGYKSGQKEVHTGSHLEARRKAIIRTLEWLRAHLS